ncbi:hypothetical protein I4U23_003110 [Adineta vaga]|nr:hypothetical protein I4U23_003110 [Adineta vaga]
MKIFWRENIQLLAIILLSSIGLSNQVSYTCNATAKCGCSKNSATVTRIVGGEAASSATWGSAVSISIANSYLCGGSIISDSWVLTAAHCVIGQTPSSVIIYAGSIQRWVGTQTRVASKIIVHSGYDTDTYVNDIALIKLTTPLTMSDIAINTICLPSVSSATLAAGEWPAAGTTVVAVGWGRLSDGGSLPTTLQQVTLQTVSYTASACSPFITDWHKHLCAGVSGGGKDTCQGDSGGPLMMFNSNNQWVLVGLTSYGDGCAEAGKSGVYTRVAAYQTWLNETMNSANTLVGSNTKLSFFLVPFILMVFF